MGIPVYCDWLRILARTRARIPAGAGCLAVVKWLLAEKAPLEALASEDQTPLFWAALHGQLACAIALVIAGASVTAKSTEGQTPLHVAAEMGSTPICKLLIDRGAR